MSQQQQQQQQLLLPEPATAASEEATILYDLSKEFEVMKDPCLFPQNLLLDANNLLYVVLADKINILSLRKIALGKCALRDVVDVKKLIIDEKPSKQVKHHFVDQITDLYAQSPSPASQKALASFILNENGVNLLSDSLLRQRLVTVNNDVLSIAIKDAKISKSGVLPGNHPLITVLLSNGDAYNLGFFKQPGGIISTYGIIQRINDFLASSQTSSNLEIMAFDWSSQIISMRSLQILVVHSSNKQLSFIGYDPQSPRGRLIGEIDLGESKSRQVSIVQTALGKADAEFKVFVVTGKNLCVVHLKIALRNNAEELIVLEEIKKLPFTFIDRVFILGQSSHPAQSSSQPSSGSPIRIILTRNQELTQLNTETYEVQYTFNSFGGILGKVLAIFRDFSQPTSNKQQAHPSNSTRLTLFNEKGQLQVITVNHVADSKQTKSKDNDIQLKKDEKEEKRQISLNYSVKPIKTLSYSSSIYLPYGIVQSSNQSCYIVCGAHSFTSQQITNVLLLNNPSLNELDSQSQNFVQLTRCIKNFQSSIFFENELESAQSGMKQEPQGSYSGSLNKNAKNNIVSSANPNKAKTTNESDDALLEKSVFAVRPLNWDDLLLQLLKNPIEFLELLKLSLLIYDKQKAMKKFGLSKQYVEDFEEYVVNLRVPPQKLRFLNEKLLLFLSSMQKQQFADFFSQQKLTIVQRNYTKAMNCLEKFHPNSAIFARLKETTIDASLERFANQTTADIDSLESIVCAATLIDVLEEPLLQCKSCRHFVIDLEKYLGSDPSNAGIQIGNIFALRGRICPLCCGLLQPLLP